VNWHDFDWGQIRTRCSTPLILNHMKASAVAEIGVRSGQFLDTILSCGNIKKAYAVDLWDDFITPGQNDVAWPREKLRKTYEDFCLKYQNDDRVEIIKKPSARAHEDIPDGMLDFVYIDGDHTLEAIREDLNNYYPKLISGGILAGHDFLNCWFKGVEFRVRDAVLEFAKELGLFVHITQEPRFKSFYIIKR
jgi:hypothetical protein